MKRQNKQEKGSVFKGADRKKKQVIGEEVAPKDIRHLERTVKLPFLADMDEGKEEYGSAEDMQEKWGLSEKQATLNVVRKRRIISLAIAFSIYSREYCPVFSRDPISSSSLSLSSTSNMRILHTESL